MHHTEIRFNFVLLTISKRGKLAFDLDILSNDIFKFLDTSLLICMHDMLGPATRFSKWGGPKHNLILDVIIFILER